MFCFTRQSTAFHGVFGELGLCARLIVKKNNYAYLRVLFNSNINRKHETKTGVNVFIYGMILQCFSLGTIVSSIVS